MNHISISVDATLFRLALHYQGSLWYVFQYKAFKENDVKKMELTGSKTVTLLAQINFITLLCLIVEGGQIADFVKKALKLI